MSFVFEFKSSILFIACLRKKKYCALLLWLQFSAEVSSYGDLIIIKWFWGDRLCAELPNGNDVRPNCWFCVCNEGWDKVDDRANGWLCCCSGSDGGDGGGGGEKSRAGNGGSKNSFPFGGNSSLNSGFNGGAGGCGANGNGSL